MHLFEITEADIGRLAPPAFADALNRLLRAEADRAGIPPMAIHTSLRLTEPDGGIDARIDAGGASRWLPQGPSVWQFKAGKDHGPSRLQKEFGKPGVQAALADGACYCVAVRESLAEKLRAARVAALSECCAAARISPDRCRLYTGADLAALMSEHPALALLPAFGRPFGGLCRWESWKSMPRYAQTFVADAGRDGAMSQVRTWLGDKNAGSPVRIEGPPGVGKTRLALETLRETGAAERTVYGGRPADVPSGLFLWADSNVNAELVLVVDECDRVDADRLRQQAERCGGRVKLITVGVVRDRYELAAPGVFMVEKLADSAMRELLASVAPSLPPEAADFVVRWASGFVKLAVEIAGAIGLHPEVAETLHHATIPAPAALQTCSEAS